MKRIIAAIGLIALAFCANAQNVPMAAFDPSTGALLAPTPTNFVRRNVLNQQGITRQVDTVADLNGTGSPYRSGEHVLVIDAGTFGNGGPVLFFHDSGSSDPTNTTDTVIATPGRWKAKRVYGSIPTFAEVSSKPTTLAGYGITDALPLSAGSNSTLTGTLYVPAIKLGSDIERTNWPTGGGGGGYVYVNGNTNNVTTNLQSNTEITVGFSGGSASFTAATANGTGDLVRTTGASVTNLSLQGTSTFEALRITGTLTVSNLTITNANMVTPRLGAATATSLQSTSGITLLALTASRPVFSGSSKELTSDGYDTIGSGGLLRQTNAILKGAPEAPLAATNEPNTNIVANLGYVAISVANAIAAIPGAAGSFTVNGGGSQTNITNSSTITATGSAGSASLATVLPQTFIWTNAIVTNWTFPTGARVFKVHMFGGGGGGGSARKSPTNGVSCGGGGGGGGAYTFAIVPVEALGGATSVTITNGAGGAGGASQTTNTSNGLNGTAGGFSSFNSIIASGGSGGSGGTASAGTGGAGGQTYAISIGGTGGAANTSGGAGGAATDLNASPYFAFAMGAAGGGAGGGIASTGIAQVGSRGGVAGSWASALKSGTGYGGGGSVNAAGGNATSAHTALMVPGSGGGGGGASVTTNGGAGGNGGRYGGGGGGGGAAGDGLGNSGAGGNGADGIVMVVVE